MADDAEVAELVEWLKELHADVRQLRLHHYIFEETQKLITANPELHQPSHFFTWMQDMYVAAMAAGIRRQLDDDPRSISMFRLLERIKADSSAVSRARYAALYTQDAEAVNQMEELGVLEQSINDTYDQFVGPGKREPSVLDINKQIGKLKKVAERFATFANKVIAHSDVTKPTKLPTFGDVDVVITYLEELVQHYYQLLKATHLSMDLNFQYDWKAVFRVPWIKPK